MAVSFAKLKLTLPKNYFTFCTRMSFVCHWYVLVCNLCVTLMYSYVMVCHSYIPVCHPYVTPTYSYIIRVSLVCTRMSLICTHMSYVCHSYALVCLVCFPYVTRMCSYVIRMSLVCTRMSSVSTDFKNKEGRGVGVVSAFLSNPSKLFFKNNWSQNNLHIKRFWKYLSFPLAVLICILGNSFKLTTTEFFKRALFLCVLHVVHLNVFLWNPSGPSNVHDCLFNQFRTEKPAKIIDHWR